MADDDTTSLVNDLRETAQDFEDAAIARETFGDPDTAHQLRRLSARAERLANRILLVLSSAPVVRERTA